MRYPRGLYHARALQLDWPSTQVLEQPHSPSEQNRHQVYVYHVEKTRSYALLHDAGGAYCDILLPRRHLRQLYGALDASVTNVKGDPS